MRGIYLTRVTGLYPFMNFAVLDLYFAVQRYTVLAKFQLCHHLAKPPARLLDSSAYDLYNCCTDKIVEPGQVALVETHLRIEPPSGYYIQIAPQSGLSFSHSIVAHYGVLFEGEIVSFLYCSCLGC